MDTAQQEAAFREAIYTPFVHQPLSPIDEAIVYRELRKTMPVSEIAALVKRCVQTVYVRLALLRLPEKQQKRVHEGRMSIMNASKWLRSHPKE